MFSGLAAIEGHHGKCRTTLASFALQGILVSAAVVLPMLNLENLPELKQRIFVPVSLGNPHVRPSQNIQQNGGPIRISPIVVHNGLTFPRVDKNFASDTDPSELPIPQIGNGGPGTSGINNMFSDNYTPPIYHPEVTKPRPISVVMEGNLIHRVEPQYPAIAKQIRLQGVVVLRAMIGSDGTIESVQVVSGPAPLARSAIAAVNQWKYRPYYLNGTPIAVETQITVKFILNQ